ncbi:unnamed protein product [Protopolystoma xenopodis]|uniref:Uncharacterized protein n=1 Tax=Protopolystoma xenopodis TaxID=117903 RepID=A0A3S4ZZV4_9PLAT|nr:unnamed protein product [Protopolystoma xenopodis]
MFFTSTFGEKDLLINAFALFNVTDVEAQLAVQFSSNVAASSTQIWPYLTQLRHSQPPDLVLQLQLPVPTKLHSPSHSESVATGTACPSYLSNRTAIIELLFSPPRLAWLNEKPLSAIAENELVYFEVTELSSNISDQFDNKDLIFRNYPRLILDSADLTLLYYFRAKLPSSGPAKTLQASQAYLSPHLPIQSAFTATKTAKNHGLPLQRVEFHFISPFGDECPLFLWQDLTPVTGRETILPGTSPSFDINLSVNKYCFLARRISISPELLEGCLHKLNETANEKRTSFSHLRAGLWFVRSIFPGGTGQGVSRFLLLPSTKTLTSLSFPLSAEAHKNVNSFNKKTSPLDDSNLPHMQHRLRRTLDTPTLKIAKRYLLNFLTAPNPFESTTSPWQQACRPLDACLSQDPSLCKSPNELCPMATYQQGNECEIRPWSYLAPDRKSQLGRLDPDTGRIQSLNGIWVGWAGEDSPVGEDASN